MRFMLGGDWPVGQHLIPVGTVLDGEAPTWTIPFRGRRYVLELEPLPGTDPIRSLRSTLKGLLRRSGMRCVDLHEAEAHHEGPIQSKEECAE